MSIIFNDSLESYAVGVDPFGSWMDIGFFHGQINTNTFNRNDGSRVYQMGLNGQIMFQDGTLSQSVTVNWLGVNTPDLVIANGLTGSLGLTLGQFHVEQDHTVSLYIQSTYTGGLFQGAALIANSVTQVFNSNTWQEYQTAWTLSTATVTQGTTTHTYVAIGGTAWVDGTKVCSGQGTTTQSIGSLPVGTLGVNNYEFSGNGFIDNLWAINTPLSTATFPFSALTAARTTQLITEVIKAPAGTARDVRATQLPVEVVKAPDITMRKARMTQAVVEIIKRSQVSGWIVHEA